MKTTEPSVSSLANPARPRATRWAALAVALVFALGGGFAARGATLLSRAPNAAVYFGLPFASLEFENPLTGTEMVLSHKVLEWRDADYGKPGHPLHDDWSASHPTEIDGNNNEIWMRRNGHSISTTTTNASTIVSIHLNGDINDGIAQVLVDGVEVARLDMYAPACCQTALIIVRGLANTTHTIQVNDLGVGAGGAAADDIATLGAAALAESDLKWEQPPVPANPTNVFYGWNQQSMEGFPPIAADDWVCTNNNPVTKIRWWGSFLNWQRPYPPQLPQGFLIRIWNDVPVGPGNPFPFSHPGTNQLHTIYCQNFTNSFEGWDYDPRSRSYETCFRFEQTLLPHEWFYQTNAPTGTNIYWISIEAFGLSMETPWGWKTRPRDPNSLAPDDAVVFDPYAPPPGMYMPLWWPDPTNSWDLAFELISQYEGSDAKWYQPPDFRMSPQGQPLGMDVNATWIPNSPFTNLLADDFLCNEPGPITNISIWASWRNDQFPSQSPTNVTFTLSFHKDYPAQPPYLYSMPGTNTWLRTFGLGQFTCTQVTTNVQEGWFDPTNAYNPMGDWTCFRYDFAIPAAQAFQQQGGGTIYWLDVQARPVTAGFLFGWKTSTDHWKDDACHAFACEPFNGMLGIPPKPWNKLTYPLGHPFEGDTVDLAFRLNYREVSVNEVKWSQRPMPYTPPDGYNGWNQFSVEGQQFVADDWACTNANPVTDIHWWGSFIGWSSPSLPEQVGPTLPDGFRIAIWEDVPKGPNNLFSYPSNVVWQKYCTNFTYEFSGWDFDPHTPGALPEACFKFTQDLRPEDWFTQDPKRGTNIYWVSIAAVYTNAQTIQYPWGWKTRLRDLNSLAPDDAVVNEPGLSPPWRPIEYPTGTSWDMAFVLTTAEGLTPTNDFSDAPSPYPTLLPNGARHTVVPTAFMGNLIDAELNGLPHPNALGDDLNNLRDEDGVSLSGLLIPGELGGVQVMVSTNGYLSAWLDFGADGSWAEASDQIFNNVPVGPPGVSLTFNIPLNAARGTNTFARFRFCTVSNAVTTFTGPAPDGEVEDYQWYIQELDFGDAKEPPFPTKYANNGARHWIQRSPPVLMGQLVDNDPDGQPIPPALGDDWNGLADEDGVILPTPLLPGQPGSVVVIASTSNAWLNAWIDFGADGSWAEAGDQIANNFPTVTGANTVNFIVPPNAAAGLHVFARFRFSTMPNLSYTNAPGVVPIGEVEDYSWHIEELDFGDAPDSPLVAGYPTLLVHNGAHHLRGGVSLGTSWDHETDGQPNPRATGDDLAGADDEDGVVFPTALIANAPATILVEASAGGLLQGWMDFNADGDWADAGEQILVNYPVFAGTNSVTFWVLNAVPGKSYARFRVSTMGSLGYTNTPGFVPDGEVEDYEITFHPLKWTQVPEVGPQGVDVRDDIPLADDFPCLQSGPITDIHLWGSFKNDMLPAAGPGNMQIALTIYADVPVGPGNPYPFSHPGKALWRGLFNPGQFNVGLCTSTFGEWWHDPLALPPLDWIPNADTNIWQLDFYIHPTNAFQQVSNTVYWLGAQYTPVWPDINYSFGWKTTYQQWNDAACWSNSAAGAWNPLIYGDGHPWAGYLPPNNWMHLAFALSTEDLDWGDAPDPTYPTLAANNGACHVIVPGLTIGNVIDKEPDGQPVPAGMGDDNNPPAGLDDEEGVFFPVLIPGQLASANVNITGTGFLNAWVDFNADGDWADAGEQIATNFPVTTGPYPIWFTVPTNAPWGATTFARFRLSTATNLSYTGLAPDGEVEDHAMSISPLPNSDLGDAPDSNNMPMTNMTAYPPATIARFPTSFLGPPVFGPFHQNARAMFLGNAVSGEFNAEIPPDQDFVTNLDPLTDTANRDGADDGLIGPVILPHCGPGLINVQVTTIAPPPVANLWLNVWCDWNRNGNWNDTPICPDGTPAPEWAGRNIPVPPGMPMVPVPVISWHPSLTKQPIWIRITMSETPAPPPLGSFSLMAAGDGPLPGFQWGETEDYYLTNYDAQETFDFADAPSPYPTLLPSGARHLIVPNFNLGKFIDADADGQPHPQALGDDQNILYPGTPFPPGDEEGVAFSPPLLAGTQACVNVFLTGPIGGKLDAWVDFNKNGVWDAAEQVFTAQGLVAGPNPGLCFNVPTNAVLGTNFARFRLSSLGGLTPTGAAQEGEVEDCQVVIWQPALSNIVITNIVVTNLVVGGNVSNVMLLQWNAQTGVQYQVQATATFSNAPPILWSNVGPIFLGPANTYMETNSVRLERYYRVMAPYTWP